MGTETQRIDWGVLGLPTWMSDRVERLGFRFPSGEWPPRGCGAGLGQREDDKDHMCPT